MLSIKNLHAKVEDAEILHGIVAGALEKITEAGAVLAGGHTTTDEAKTSMTDTVPKPMRASDDAMAPREIVSTASPTFHPMVPYSRSSALRW